MRIPNLSVSDSITRTIRDLELKRFELDQQISTGQKIKYPEDDGLRVGKLINLESEKSKLSQYKRNSSQAKEFLNAGHLNLDHLRQLNQRAVEIARVAGTELNQSAAETYGHEISELVEEALNRINASHRGTSLFAGNELKPNFGNTEVIIGNELKTSISLNDSLVGTASADGNRILAEGEHVVFQLNGREYVVEATKDGLTTSKISEIVRDLVNNDTGSLDQSPRLPDPISPDADFPWYRAYVRGGESPNVRNSNANLTSKISNNGDLLFYGTVGEKYHSSVSYISQWNPSTYFPEQVEDKIAQKTAVRYPGVDFKDLTEQEKEVVRNEVFEVGSQSFDQTQFQISLDSKAIQKYRAEYSSRLVPVDVKGWSDLDVSDQDIVWKDAYDEFYNNGDLVFNLSDAEVQSLTGEALKGGDYSFVYYQDTSDSLLPMTGYLKPMELNSDGVWRRSSSPTNDDIRISDLANFYVSGTKYGQPIDEFDSLMVDDYVIQNRWQPVGAAPVMNWSRDVSVESESIQGSSTLNIEHADPWKRLSQYELGELVMHDGNLWESQIDANFNRKPGLEGNYWKQLPSDYDTNREDWNLSSTATENRIYFLSPDGRLFDEQLDAQFHTEDILLESKTYENSIADLTLDAAALVKQIVYPVSRFAVEGSESSATTVFDQASQKYRIVAAGKDGEIINGQYVKGDIIDSTVDPSALTNGAVVLHEGRYFLVTDETNLDSNAWNSLSATNLEGGGLFLLPNGLPKKGLEKVLMDNSTVSGKKGDILFHRSYDTNNNNLPIDRYYVAKDDYNGESVLAGNIFFEEVNASVTDQGSAWSSNDTYDSGEIVFYKGSYYQSRQDNLKSIITVEDELGNFQGQFAVFPDDEFYLNENGQSVKNTFWAKLTEEGDLNHVLSFKIDNQNQPAVRLPTAGTSGVQASAEAVVDANGEVVGLRVADRGQYFFGSSTSSSTIHSDFQNVEVDLADGSVLSAKIIWQADNTNGSYFVSGFEGLTISSGQNNVSSTTPKTGDTFSFATGVKTFLDHRDQDGNLLNVSYLGGAKNSSATVGSDADLSFLLDASEDGTKNLADVVKSLIDLRTGLSNSTSSDFADEVFAAEKKLSSLEDDIVNKMGELTASMVRIESVNSHDEEYSMSIDKQISNDLEIDLSEAIMRLTRISTSYQAAMQVGSQMLNNSLLNYL